MTLEWIAGHHAVQAILESGRRSVHAFYTSDLRKCPPRLLALAEERRLQVRQVTPNDLNKHAPSTAQQGVLLQVGPYPYVDLEDVLETASAPVFLLALDQIQDPHNCGALLRSAYAWGVTAVLLSKDQSAPITPVVVRSSAGASEFLPIVRLPGLPQQLSNLKKRGIWIVGADASGIPMTQSRLLAEPIVLVMGGEGSGLRQTTLKVCDETLSIPMRTNGSIDSLNVSVAGGVLMWEIAKARGF